MGCPSCDLVVPDKRNALISSPAYKSSIGKYSVYMALLKSYIMYGTLTYLFNLQACHPEPGKHYDGITRTAYLPANAEGREVLLLLKRAFDEGLTFTIGNSTSGRSGVITWNDIRHKTRIDGGRRQ